MHSELVRTLLLLTLVMSNVFLTLGCLPALKTARSRFEVCRQESSECFIFLNEPPFVFMDEAEFRDNPDRQLPFPCVAHENHSSSLEGAFFDLVNEIREPLRGAHCVWGGPSCTFDSLVLFIESTTESGYKWVAGGLLFMVPERRSVNLIPTATLLEDQLRVIGPPLESTSAAEAWATIWKPFTLPAWMFIGACMVGHFMMRAWMAWRFSNRHNRWQDRFIQFAGGPEPDDDWSEPDSLENSHWERMNNIWVTIAKLFIAIAIIMWEVAIAVLVFEARTEMPTSNLKTEGFAIWKGTTQEYFFVRMNKLNSTDNATWTRLNSQKAVYDALLDGSGKNKKIRTSLGYTVFNRYQFRNEPQLCDNLRQYDTVPASLVQGREPPSISGVWLMSKNVKPQRRVAIDRGIVEKKTFHINRFVNSYAGDEVLERCKATSRRIDWILLVLLFGLATGPLFLVYTLALLYYTFYKKKRRQPTDGNDSTYPQYTDTPAPQEVDLYSNGPLRQRNSTMVYSV